MKRFSLLFERLDQTSNPEEQLRALSDYFEHAPDEDKIWTIALLQGKKPKRLITTNQLKDWAEELVELPNWLLEDAQERVADIAECLALLLPKPQNRSEESLHFWIQQVLKWKNLEEEDCKLAITESWNQLNSTERYIINKLITGGWRLTIGQKLLCTALAKATNSDAARLAHRLLSNWSPLTTSFEDLVFSDDPRDALSKPYPFYLASHLKQSLEDLGAIDDWIIENKWDGIRGQLIIRGGEIFLWSRREELITAKFPEFDCFSELPEGYVIDGEILPYQNHQPLKQELLLSRMGRKAVSKKIMKDCPVVFMAYDLLEAEGVDIRKQPLEERRKKLAELIAQNSCDGKLLFSNKLAAENWNEVAELHEACRSNHIEGLMLKRKGSPFREDRKKGDFWKWKMNPLTVDAVLLYAQTGQGRWSNLYTNYTMAVWDGDTLVPITKVDSGLSDHQFMELSLFVNKNTIERFGPVRSVTPTHVFEIAFEAIHPSARHKCGITLRAPKILSWRIDKKVEDADQLDALKSFLPS